MKCHFCGKDKVKKMFTLKQSVASKPHCRECSSNQVSILSSQRNRRIKKAKVIVATKYVVIPKPVRKNKKQPIKYNDRYELAKNKVFQVFGRLCNKCGETDSRVMQLDHVNGGGTKERKKMNSLARYTRALKEPEKYQILCANCNVTKKFENGEL